MFFWPLKRSPVPITETPTWSLYYQAACPPPSDPTIIWGTEVPMAGIEAYLKRRNATGEVLLSPAHVLVAAVGRCLRAHPQFNRRLLRRRLYDFRQVNVLFPMLDGHGAPEVCLLRAVDGQTPAEIARAFWQMSRQLTGGTSPYQEEARLFRRLPAALRGPLFRLVLRACNRRNWPALLWRERTCSAAAMVSYLGHRGAPPMRMYKPSRFPTDVTLTNVTMGPTEAGRDGPLAPLFVRTDHRLVAAYDLSLFVADLRRLLMEPAQLEEAAVPAVIGDAAA
jgi:hypothetical protein